MDHENFPWLTAMGFAFLTFNSGMAIYRSDGDAGSVAFVAISYLDLLLLFYCLRLYEKSPQNSQQRFMIKVVVWLLTTILTGMFSYKVAALMPVPVAVVVWAMASATILGGFYAFFLHQEPDNRAGAGLNGSHMDVLFIKTLDELILVVDRDFHRKIRDHSNGANENTGFSKILLSE